MDANLTQHNSSISFDYYLTNLLFKDEISISEIPSNSGELETKLYSILREDLNSKLDRILLKEDVNFSKEQESYLVLLSKLDLEEY